MSKYSGKLHQYPNKYRNDKFTISSGKKNEATFFFCLRILALAAKVKVVVVLNSC